MKFIFVFLSLFLFAFQKSTGKKHILVFTFPGGKSHVFIMKTLINYTLQKLKEEKSELDYIFHILVHNYDISLWKDVDKEKIKVYGFGSVELYDSKFALAMKTAQEDPVFGYSKFNDAMIFLNGEFLRAEDILEKFKKIKFELIISDVVNMVAPFLRKELKIKKMIYVNPTCVYTWLIPNMEYNASYEPVIGTTFGDQMNFFQRLINFSIKKGSEFMYYRFKNKQNKLFIEKGYGEYDPFQPRSLFLNQCVNGVHFPLSLPPNIIPIGAVLPSPSKPIKDEKLDSFLNKYPKNIYVSQGTITKAMNIPQLVEMFKQFPDVGFVFSIRKDMEGYELPPNVLGMSWVPQNDLLGDPRLSAFLTHGGLNSILESIYHSVPMIVIGINIDQVNSAVLIRERKYGISFTRDKEVTLKSLTNAIREIINNKEYKENVSKGSSILRSNNGRENFYYWLNYVIKNGYDHLLVPAILNYKSYELYNFDIISILVLLLIIVFLIIKYVFKGCFKLMRRN